MLFKAAIVQRDSHSVMKRGIRLVLLVAAAIFVRGNLGSSNRGKRCEYNMHHKPYAATAVKSEPDRIKSSRYLQTSASSATFCGRRHKSKLLKKDITYVNK